MNALLNLLSPSTMHFLGWTLLHFVWQGAALAALAALLMTLCRRAQARYAIAVVALVAMLVAPAGTFYVLTHANAASPESFEPVAQASRAMPRNISAAAPSAASQLSRLRQSLPWPVEGWLVEAWLLGVAFFGLRSAGGFLLLERERRKQSGTVSDRLLTICLALQHRLGLKRVIRYCECQWLQAPAVIGWFRPIVLLPVTALTGLSEDQLQSVIAHELAHIQRFDAFVNAFQIAVETLLFYHPAVWWLNKRIRVEREHCCDDTAVSLCGNPVEYARALTLMEEWRSAPALAMAANRGPLSERIFRVLGLKSSGSATRAAGVASGIVCLTAALAAGNVLFGIAYPKMHAAASRPQVMLGQVGLSLSQSAATAPAAPAPVAKPSAAFAPASAPRAAAPTTPQAAPQAALQAAPQSAPQPAPQAAPGGSYIDAMKAAGLGDLTVDELVSLKIQNVTPEYIRGLHELGLHLDVDTVVSMKIQGVTPEYIHEVRELGLNPDDDQIVGMKIQGVTPDYVRGMRDAGFKPDVDQLISMRIQGVTPEYVRALREQGLQPDGDDVVSMRIQHVDIEYIRAIHALGFKPSVDEFVSMRIQGVTPEYIKALQAAGLTFDMEELVDARIQGVTAEFIAKAAKHGFKNLTLEKLIQLKQTGVLDSEADI